MRATLNIAILAVIMTGIGLANTNQVIRSSVTFTELFRLQDEYQKLYDVQPKSYELSSISTQLDREVARIMSVLLPDIRPELVDNVGFEFSGPSHPQQITHRRFSCRYPLKPNAQPRTAVDDYLAYEFIKLELQIDDSGTNIISVIRRNAEDGKPLGNPFFP